MIQIGQTNRLTVLRETDLGVFLDADSYGTVLLPKRLVPKDISVGQVEAMDVFLYFDSDRQLSATTERPIAEVGEWGLMRIVGISRTGAFVDWGIRDKDLLIPFSEQRGRLSEGQTILVYVYTDKASGRIVGTTKFNKWLDQEPAHYTPNQKVELLVAERSEFGFKAIINGKHWGMLFQSDVFGKVFVGKRLKGFIKQIRSDGKIDVSLQKVGVAKMDDLSEKILLQLRKNDGFLPLTDRSSPEEIYTEFRTSKGTFKKTIGHLYKKGMIVIEGQGIRLVADDR
jgi:predicted RNA-binding protein (virulence factor B family)